MDDIINANELWAALEAVDEFLTIPVEADYMALAKATREKQSHNYCMVIASLVTAVLRDNVTPSAEVVAFAENCWANHLRVSTSNKKKEKRVEYVRSQITARFGRR
jgi:hypothetical protein